MTRDELGVLLERYVDGSADPQECRALADALLAGDADARWLAGELASIGRIQQVLDDATGEEFVRGLAERMRAEGRGSDFLSDHSRRRRRVQTRQSVGALAWLAAAAAAVVVLSLVWTARPRPTRPSPPERQAARPDVPVEAPPPVPPPPPPPPPRPAPEPPLPAVVPNPPKPIEAPPIPAPPPPPPPVPPAPRETAPARIFLPIAKLEGTFEIRREKAWEKLDPPAEWDAGAALRARESLGRFALADGTRVTLRGKTEIRIVSAAPPVLSFDQGEAFFEVSPGGPPFAVVTPDARAEVLGTQFGVRRQDRTDVVVVAGEVRVANEKGEVAVPAGSGTTVRKAVAPSKPKAADTDALAWRRAADPPETVRFRYDFEDGRQPTPWTNGRVAAGPARGFNRFCLEGIPNVDAQLTRLDADKVAVRGALRIRFRYYAEGGSEFLLQLKNERVGDNFRYEVKNLVHRKWEAVDVPLSDFYRLADRTSKLQDGDRFTWLNVTVAGARGAVWFDDIELVEVRR